MNGRMARRMHGPLPLRTRITAILLQERFSPPSATVRCSRFGDIYEAEVLPVSPMSAKTIYASLTHERTERPADRLPARLASVPAPHSPPRWPETTPS